jgi:hypothetical protein
MAAENIAAGTQAHWEKELERSRRSGVRLLDSLARKMGAVRALGPAETREAPRGPIYAVAAALAAGLLIGMVIKRAAR